MKCYICNATLSATEIQWNKDHKEWDPCSTCLEEIDNVFTDDSEDEINQQLVLELDLDVEDEDENNDESPAKKA